MRTGISWLDVRLGLRMLVKYPGLSIVGGLGMAVAIAIGAGAFEIVSKMTSSELPLEEGERIVAIQNRDAATNGPDRRALHDLGSWRREVRSVEELGAFRMRRRNLAVAKGAPEPVSLAEMTASGFRVARVAPLLGRPLIEEDEREGAPAVVVIGHDAWQRRFGGDPDVLGRTVRLDDEVHTVVGVMPEGFAFPVNHGYWTPLQTQRPEYGRRAGPAIFVFGRLAPRVTLEQAQAELTTVGQRAAAAFPDTHAQLRPRVLPYTHPFTDLDDPGMFWMLSAVQVLVTLLLVVVAVNVAILVYARTATRRGEIVVRTALGASRRRIVAQLFVESLVLSLAAAAAGLLIVSLALRQAEHVVDSPPFWIDFELSPLTALYAVGLAVLGALIVGVAPGLKATGRRLQSSLRELGGGTGMQMGRTWTLLIVAQVAIAVATLPVAVAMGWNEFFRSSLAGPEARAEELLTARIALSGPAAPTSPDGAPTPGEGGDARRGGGSLLADRHAELMRRVGSERDVSAATYVSRLPGEEFTGSIEIDPGPVGGQRERREIRFLQVDPGFFDIFGATVLAGRAFEERDLRGEANGVIANRSFVQRVLGGGEALGRRFRYTRTEDRLEPGGVEQGGWYEIVGIVGDLAGSDAESGTGEPTLYHPAAPGEINPMSLVVRTQGIAPEAFAGRLREITTALDPKLRLDAVLSVEQIRQQGQRTRRSLALAMGVATLSVLLLSAAGIHALMSFTVTRRRREIGIRSALGADPRRILASVFGQAVRQLGLGLGLGIAAAALVDRLSGGALMWGAGLLVLVSVAILMTAVGLLAALGPARKGLSIQPTEALRADG